MANISTDFLNRVVLSREDRVLKFGVDCVGPNDSDGICFNGGEWGPGGEYIKKLRVKNVSNKTVKLKYKLPATRFFALAFPEVMVLSPGMVQEVDVSFRPISYENYDDTIHFKILHDSPHLAPIGFHVPVRAFISTLRITAPVGLDFGFCTVNEESARTFELVNVGQVPAPFRWDVPSTFTLEPMQGEVPVGQATTVRVSILPTHASVFVVSAVCHVGEGIQAIKPDPVLTTKFSAIGKYPHLSVSEETVDFGRVQIGSKGEAVVRDFLLRNHSVVPVSFRMVREEDDCDNVFAITPTQGVVPFQGEVRFRVTYTPTAFGTYSSERFTFFTPGGNAPQVTVTGSAVGAGIVVAKSEDPKHQGQSVPNSINFNDVKVGQFTTRVVFLYNRSSLPVCFNFITGTSGSEEGGPDSVFEFDRTRGVVPAGLETHVNLRFSPSGPANYYKRIFCLVENQHPAYLDIYGTGYIAAKGEVKEQRPAPLRHSHIQAFRNRVAAGLGHLSPEELDKMLDDEGISDFFARPGIQHTRVMATSKVSNPMTRSGESTRNELAHSSEFFIAQSDKDRQVLVDMEDLDFGFLQSGGSKKDTITLTNRTNAKVTATWTSVADGSFVVTPESADISPYKTVQFTVTFMPSKASVYYQHTLECLVFFKSQRSFRLVNDATMSPPWMLSVAAQGHSFPGEQFLAKVSIALPGHRLTFPACHLGDSVYQTLRLTNHAKLPASFNFHVPPGAAFAVKPALGVVPAQDFQLVELRFTPQQSGMHRLALPVVFNNTEETTQTLSLMGLGQTPQIRVLDVGPEGIFLKPTSVGLLSTFTFRLQNDTRVPLAYHVLVPDKCREVFSVSPHAGYLKGKEVEKIQVSFVPQRERTYRMQLPIVVKALAGPAPDFRDAGQIGEAKAAVPVQRLAIKVMGPTCGPALAFEPPQLDFGVLLVNNQTTRDLTLVNNSDSDIRYELTYVCYPLSADGSPEKTEEPGLHVVPMLTQSKDHTLTVNLPSGVLPARSKTVTRVTFQPAQARAYSYAIVANLRSVDKDGNVLTLNPSESALLSLSDKVRSDLTEAEGDEGFGEDGPTSGAPAHGGGSSLVCSLRGKSTFPSVVVSDMRLQNGGLGSSTVQLWRQFNLLTLNKVLMEPLTPAEVAFNRESSPDLHKLPSYPVAFSPAVLGEPSQMCFLQLRNSGDLPSSFSIHLPNEREIEMEHWADDGEPTEEEVLFKAVIDEIKCFEVYPRMGSLLPGQTLTLNMAYHYRSMRFKGVHRLPILLRISQGKQFWIVLEGRTIDVNTPFLYPLIGPSQEVPLFPVPIGTTQADAPVQYTELVNPTEIDLQYELDVSPLDRVKRHNHDFPILTLDNPKGQVLAKSKATLKWRFCPLECRQYQARMHLTYTSMSVMNGAMSPVSILLSPTSALKEKEKAERREDLAPRTAKFTIVATGYDIREEDYHRKPVPHVNTGLAPPCYQMVSPPDTLALLSQDRLNFGRVMARTSSTRIITLRNVLTDRSVEYSWTDTHSLVQSGVVSFHPKCGLLAPGEFALLRVKLAANVNPTVINNCVELRLKDTATAKSPKTKGSMDLLRAKISERASTSSTMGHTHVPVVSRMTVARGAALDAAEAEMASPLPTDTDLVTASTRKPHLPTSETRPPPPGPEGSPIRRQVPKAKVSAGMTTRSVRSHASSLRSAKSARSAATSAFTGTADTATSEPVTVSMEVHLLAEVVRESSGYLYDVEDVSRLFAPRPHKHIAPEHPALVPETLLGGRRESASKTSGYVDEDYLDDEGGNLVGSALSQIFRELLACSEVNQTIMKGLREEERCPFFAELKPERPPYAMLAEALGVGRNDHYLVAPETVVSKLLGMGIPIKFKTLQGILKTLPRVSPESVQGQGLMGGGEMIDLRRLVAKLPHSMQSVIDSWLAMKASMDRRGKRRRSSAYGSNSNLNSSNNNGSPTSGDGYGSGGFSNYDDAGSNRRGSYAKTGMMASLKMDASLPARSSGLYAETASSARDEGARSTQINPINRRGSFTRASFTGGVPEVKVEDKIGEMVRKEALLDPECEELVHTTLEETVYNLLQECLVGDFNLLARPKQYIIVDEPIRGRAVPASE